MGIIGNLVVKCLNKAREWEGRLLHCVMYTWNNIIIVPCNDMELEVAVQNLHRKSFRLTLSMNVYRENTNVGFSIMKQPTIR